MHQFERLGAFVVTHASEVRLSDGIRCAYCETLLADYTAETDSFSPTAEQLHRAGAVAVPNFGWLCDQACANACEQKTGVRFQRDETGMVRYY